MADAAPPARPALRSFVNLSSRNRHFARRSCRSGAARDRQKPIEFVSDYAACQGKVDTDLDPLVQVLMHLHNAAKFTDEEKIGLAARVNTWTWPSPILASASMPTSRKLF